MALRKHWMSFLTIAIFLVGTGCDSGNSPDEGAPNPSQAEQETSHDHDHDEGTSMKVLTEPYGETPDGQQITQYMLSNGNGMSVSIINYGAIVTAVNVPDKDGKVENITLTEPNLDAWIANEPYFGAIVGRYANRIARGKFSLDGQEYTLATNNAPNHLHGGDVGFNKVVWDAEPLTASATEAGVALRYHSKDGEEGYPGTLDVEVKYILTSENELRIEYNATTDKKTVVNLTNHCYWNLGGASSGQILDHELTLYCDKYLTVDETLIPTGNQAPVANTPMDFTEPHALGERIDQVEGGYDHCYVINGEVGKLRPAAKVKDPKTGRVMEITTDQPGIQLYSGNFLNGEPTNGGFKLHEGFCLETQLFPDSPNQPDFPTATLEPGNVYKHVTVHKFSVEK